MGNCLPVDVTIDGFTGLGVLRRPKRGDTLPVAANAYHAGTETNPEDRADMVLPCQGLIGI